MCIAASFARAYVLVWPPIQSRAAMRSEPASPGPSSAAGVVILTISRAFAVLSGERGQISIAHNGRMIRRLDAQRLESVLRAFYQLDRHTTPPRGLKWLRRLLGIQSKTASPAAGSSGSSPRRTVDG